MNDFIEVDGQQYVSMERYRELSAYCQQLQRQNEEMSERLASLESFTMATQSFLKSVGDLNREQQEIRDWYNHLLARDKQALSNRGVIYVIRDVNVTGYCKIGKSTNVKARFNNFAVSLPFKCEVVAILPTNDIHRAEANLHTLFADKRVNGEWFNLDKDDIEVIMGMKKRKK